MRLVQLQEGALELQWTWLPFWIACNPNLRAEVEAELRDVMLLNGATASDIDLDGLSAHALKTLKTRYPAAAPVLDAIAAATC